MKYSFSITEFDKVFGEGDRSNGLGNPAGSFQRIIRPEATSRYEFRFLDLDLFLQDKINGSSKKLTLKINDKLLGVNSAREWLVKG